MRKIVSVLALAFALLASSAYAQCPKCGKYHGAYARQPVRNTMQGVAGFVRDVFDGSEDALDEVNAARARKGLRPFLRDPLLTQGALACARARAARRLHGHTSNDFAYLPAGAIARAGGCGALDDSWGWGTCCTYERWTYAGAAWVRGADGKRYMQLFVR